MFTWRAIYKDGSEHPYDSVNFSIDNVDTSKLDLFQIKDVESDIPLLNIHFDDPRKRLIYVRRTEMHSKLPHPIIQHIVGWQMNVNGENVQSICHVFETIIVSFEDVEENGVKRRRKIERHLHWIEMAGKFNPKRDSHFKAPSEEQLKIIGSNPN